MLSWTPILALAVVGLVLFRRVDRPFATYLMVAAFSFYLVISFYPDWDGLSSFGNRFFVSLTSVFVLGLASLFDRLFEQGGESAAAAPPFGGAALFFSGGFG